jgi:hypothetical protein
MAELDPAIEKAFEFAQEATKQLITLATGVIALTITFLKDVLGTDGSAGFLQAAWVLYLVSIVFGVLTLLNLTGNLERPGPGSTPSIYRGEHPLLLMRSGADVLPGGGFHARLRLQRDLTSARSSSGFSTKSRLICRRSSPASWPRRPDLTRGGTPRPPFRPRGRRSAP